MLHYKQLNPFAEIQIYMFTHGVKINYITVWSYPNTPLLCLLMFLATHWTHPAGRCPIAGCDDDSRMLFFIWPVQPRLEKSFYPPPNHLRASSLKDKRFGSEQASKAHYSRGGILAFFKIMHEHNSTEAVRGNNKRWLSHCPHLNIFPATTAPHQGMSHAILRSSLWPGRQSPATGATHCWIKPCHTFQFTASR